MLLPGQKRFPFPIWGRVDASIDAAPPPGPVTCAGCGAPCCWNMKLLDFHAGNWHDLEYVHFIAGFHEFEIDYENPARFRIFYRAPCRHLDQDSLGCTLHGTPDKPQTCVVFDESDCYYRDAHLGRPLPSAPVVRLDRRRWLAMAPLFKVDADGTIVHMPTAQEVLETLEAAAPDPASEPRVRQRSWEALHVEPIARHSFGDRTSPCEGCHAPCCNVVIFDRPTPTTVHNLEFMRYQLGFPGVEAAVSSGGWRILVRTTCSAFDDVTNLCTLYGQPSRPTLCTHFNPYLCSYRKYFSAGPDEVLRLEAADVRRLIARLPDEAGRLPNDLSPAAVRKVLSD